MTISRACDLCHKRKVKCDKDNGIPCSNCILYGSKCTFECRAKKKKSAPVRLLRPLRPKVSPGPTSGGQNHEKIQTQTPETRSSGDITDPIIEGAREKQMNADRSKDHGNQAVDLSLMSVKSLVSDYDTKEEEMSRDSLRSFFSKDTEYDTSLWNCRTVYIGNDDSNIARLVKLQYDRPNAYHYPTNTFKEFLPWKPSAEMAVSLTNPALATECAALPEKSIRDDLVNSYFKFINPIFPVVEETEFRRLYADKNNPPPLIVLQAVLLVGAHASSHEKVSRYRSLVKKTLFNRTRALFAARYENNRIHMVQAALLMTYYFEGADDACTNSWYYCGMAVRIAQGLGMHRNTYPSMMPPYDSKMWRRLWWLCMQAEAVTALTHGRPAGIDPNSYDVPPLNEADFIDENGQTENADLEFLQKNCQLSELILEYVAANAPGKGSSYLQKVTALTPTVYSQRKLERFRDIENALKLWFQSLPPRLLNPLASPESRQACYIHVHFHTLNLHLQRNFNDARGSSLRSESAQALIDVINIMHKKNFIRGCYFSMVTGIFAAAVQLFAEVDENLRRNENEVYAVIHKIEMLFPVMIRMAVYWPFADSVHQLCKSLSQQMKRKARNRQPALSTPSSTPEGPLHNSRSAGLNYSDSLLNIARNHSTKDTHPSKDIFSSSGTGGELASRNDRGLPGPQIPAYGIMKSPIALQGPMTLDQPQVRSASSSLPSLDPLSQTSSAGLSEAGPYPAFTDGRSQKSNPRFQTSTLNNSKDISGMPNLDDMWTRLFAPNNPFMPPENEQDDWLDLHAWLGLQVDSATI